MSQLDETLMNLAPRVASFRDLPGSYRPRHCLAIYWSPIPGYSLSASGVALGEAMASRNGLGCTLLDGIPDSVPDGAVVISLLGDLKAAHPALAEGLPELQGSRYALRLDGHALVAAASTEGLAAGIQTLSMLVLRHGGDAIPGCLIVDGPVCDSRGIAVELAPGEASANLLMQMASFAATFKANRLQLILDPDFNPKLDIPGLSGFHQLCQSYGVTVGVRLPWLGDILAGRRQLRDAWAGLRAAARLFGASRAALDDPCPPGTDKTQARLVMDSILGGEIGLPNVSVDARLLFLAECTPYELKSMNLSGWHRFHDPAPPPPELENLPLRLEVPAPIPGFSGHSFGRYHRTLDAALSWLRGRPRRQLLVSFRDIGVSHLWQNLLYPAATGIISAWGNPREADQAAWLFSSLLYGSAASRVMDVWDLVAAAHPPGLTAEDERRLRRVAFGHWPEDERTRELLAMTDWNTVSRNVAAAAARLQDVAGSLPRNAATLTGARLGLQALSWLHCFATLAPELERRRQSGSDEDGRTDAIAANLYGGFGVWRNSLGRLRDGSGLELAEMGRLEEMRLRLQALCASREIFD